MGPGAHGDPDLLVHLRLQVAEDASGDGDRDQVRGKEADREDGGAQGGACCRHLSAFDPCGGMGRPGGAGVVAEMVVTEGTDSESVGGWHR